MGAWLTGLGWAAGHAARVDDVASVRPLGVTGAAFVVLQVLALLRHGDVVGAWDRAPAMGYLAGLSALGVVSAWSLAAQRGARVTATVGTASASPR